MQIQVKKKRTINFENFVQDKAGEMKAQIMNSPIGIERYKNLTMLALI